MLTALRAGRRICRPDAARRAAGGCSGCRGCQPPQGGHHGARAYAPWGHLRQVRGQALAPHRTVGRRQDRSGMHYPRWRPSRQPAKHGGRQSRTACLTCPAFCSAFCKSPIPVRVSVVGGPRAHMRARYGHLPADIGRLCGLDYLPVKCRAAPGRQGSSPCLKRLQEHGGQRTTATRLHGESAIGTGPEQEASNRLARLQRCLEQLVQPPGPLTCILPYAPFVHAVQRIAAIQPLQKFAMQGTREPGASRARVCSASGCILPRRPPDWADRCTAAVPHR